MPYIRTGRNEPKVPTNKPDGSVNQALPVQNTWYTVLATTQNVRIYAIGLRVATTNEDLAVEIIIDGITQTVTQAAVGDTTYRIQQFTYGTSTDLGFSATDFGSYRAFLIEARSVSVRVRKTSAAGTGTLSCSVKYATFS